MLCCPQGEERTHTPGTKEQSKAKAKRYGARLSSLFVIVPIVVCVVAREQARHGLATTMTSAQEREDERLSLTRHALFARRCAVMLPWPYAQEESSRLMLAYFSTAILALIPARALRSSSSSTSDDDEDEEDAVRAMLGDGTKKSKGKGKARASCSSAELDEHEHEAGYTDWVYTLQASRTGGFRGTDSFDMLAYVRPASRLGLLRMTTTQVLNRCSLVGDPCSEHKRPEPTLVMSYTALLLLGMLRDDFARLDKRALGHFVRSCQLPDGSCVILVARGGFCPGSMKGPSWFDRTGSRSTEDAKSCPTQGRPTLPSRSVACFSAAPTRTRTSEAGEP